MVTNHLQEIAAQSVPASSDGGCVPSLVSRILAGLSRLICGMHGHDSLLHFGHDRMFLRCASCGYESPGWELGAHRPRVRFRGDGRRRVLVAQRAQWMRTRRIA